MLLDGHLGDLVGRFQAAPATDGKKPDEGPAIARKLARFGFKQLDTPLMSVLGSNYERIRAAIELGWLFALVPDGIGDASEFADKILRKGKEDVPKFLGRSIWVQPWTGATFEMAAGVILAAAQRDVATAYMSSASRAKSWGERIDARFAEEKLATACAAIAASSHFDRSFSRKAIDIAMDQALQELDLNKRALLLAQLAKRAALNGDFQRAVSMAEHAAAPKQMLESYVVILDEIVKQKMPDVYGAWGFNNMKLSLNSQIEPRAGC
jgi:hypothetical protein